MRPIELFSGIAGQRDVKRVFMVGIGGASMNGLAELLASMGFEVTGSDRVASESTARLEERGIRVAIGHDASNIGSGSIGSGSIEVGNIDSGSIGSGSIGSGSIGSGSIGSGSIEAGHGGAPGDGSTTSLPDIVVHTAAVRMDNPELARAASLGLPIMSRAELLGRVMAAHGMSYAVAGAHGKTTTTAMLGEILVASGCDPTINVGADYGPLGGGMRIGGRAVFAAEACEYEGSFLELRPAVAAITNIEYDHADYYRDLEHLKCSFRQFALQAGDRVVADGGDANSADVYRSLSEDERAKWFFFGIEGEHGIERIADGRYAAFARDIEIDSQTRPSFQLSLHRVDAVHAGHAGHEGHAVHAVHAGHEEPANGAAAAHGSAAAHGVAEFQGDEPANGAAAVHGVAEFQGDEPANGAVAAHGVAEFQGDEPANGAAAAPAFSRRVRLKVAGAHNVKNALAAACAAHAAGLPAEVIVEGLEHFSGVKKRFEYLGAARGMDIVDDYAHHPSEVLPALAAAKHRARGADVWCVFQPHTYTRTKAFFHEFSRAFRDATHVILADIYAAREIDPGDISSALLAEAIRSEGVDALHIGGGFDEIAKHVAANAKPGDLVVTMGAGHASRVADILLAMDIGTGCE